jgi:hypothetical protein
MMKNYIIFFLYLTLVGVSANGQMLVRQTVGVSGSSMTLDLEGSTYVIQQSIGQASVIGTFQTPAISARQGFIQPLNVKVVSKPLEDGLNLSIYPNPFKSQLMIKFDKQTETSVEFQIWDLLGRQVYYNQFPPSSEIPLDLNFLSKAQYIMNITSGSAIYTTKIIKN